MYSAQCWRMSIGSGPPQRPCDLGERCDARGGTRDGSGNLQGCSAVSRAGERSRGGAEYEVLPILAETSSRPDRLVDVTALCEGLDEVRYQFRLVEVALLPGEPRGVQCLGCHAGPGLRCGGGIYLFEDAAAAERYREKHERRLSARGLTGDVTGELDTTGASSPYEKCPTLWPSSDATIPATAAAIANDLLSYAVAAPVELDISEAVGLHAPPEGRNLAAERRDRGRRRAGDHGTWRRPAAVDAVS
jgi:hypothetical protein